MSIFWNNVLVESINKVRQEELWLLHTDGQYFSYAVVAAYLLVFVYGLPAMFKNRESLNLKSVITWWNFVLFLFSLICVIWSFVWNILIFQSDGFNGLVCDPNGQLWKGQPMFIIFIFLISKYVELGDTFFLAIGKKPMHFLHWYHHATVLLYCLLADSTKSSLAWLFGVVNAWIHSFMYYYYYQATIGRKVWWGKWLTLAQTSQMVIGIFLTGTWVYYNYVMQYKCSTTNPELLLAASIVMYGSYFILFIRFYGEKYEGKPSEKDKLAKKA